MLNPLNKRFKRDLKSDFGKYVAIFLFLVFFIGAVSGFFIPVISRKIAWAICPCVVSYIVLHLASRSCRSFFEEYLIRS